MDSFISYLRYPVLASTGVATLLSGLLYFKQKWVFSVRCPLAPLFPIHETHVSPCAHYTNLN